MKLTQQEVQVINAMVDFALKGGGSNALGVTNAFIAIFQKLAIEEVTEVEQEAK
jgi:hypothetical protein